MYAFSAFWAQMTPKAKTRGKVKSKFHCFFSGFHEIYAQSYTRMFIILSYVADYSKKNNLPNTSFFRQSRTC